MTTPFTPERLTSLVDKHASVLAKAAADKHGIDANEMTVLPEEAFESESEPGTLCVIFKHPTGLYSVATPIGEDDAVGPFSINHL